MAKRPLPNTADMAFLRSVINTLSEARSLRRFADAHVLQTREMIARRVATALWRRYRTYQKKGLVYHRSFADWLYDCGTLEATYLYHSYQTRLYWVYRVIQSTKDPMLAIFGEAEHEYGDWYIARLQQLIQGYQSSGERSIVLKVELVDTSKNDRVPTIRFNRSFEEVID